MYVRACVDVILTFHIVANRRDKMELDKNAIFTFSGQRDTYEVDDDRIIASFSSCYSLCP